LPWQERSILRAEQVVQGDYFAFGPLVAIHGTVNGDLYAVGGEIVVNGTVNGDVIAAGGRVTLSGTVSQDARIAGGRVTVSGKVGRNLAVAGADILLTESAQIHENLLAGGGHVELSGTVGRDARVGAGSLTIANGIGRDAAVAAASVRLTAKATIGGKLRYWSQAAPSMEEGATVRGGVVRRPLPEWWQEERLRQGLTGLRLTVAVMSFVSTLVAGLVLLRLYPMFTLRVAAMIREKPGAVFGWGLAALVGIPLAVLVCLVTLIGVPLGMVLLALYGATLYLARIYTVTWLGQIILRQRADSLSVTSAFLTGLIVYSLLALIPWVGGVLTLVTVLVGLGALLMTKKELVATLREHGEI
jgi:cytoskeletal protein CcmA (bactofilin family)